MRLQFPYIKYETKGIMNYTVNKFSDDIPIKLSSSSLETTLESIYYDNDNYFCTSTNNNYTQNYLIIEFTDYFIKAFGYIIKSDFKSSNDWYLKSWKVEGSIDNQNWEYLHSLKNSNDLSTFEGGSYSIKNHNIIKFLKITQTGESGGDSTNAKYRLRIRYFDVFGILSNHIYFGTCIKPHKRSFIPLITLFPYIF